MDRLEYGQEKTYFYEFGVVSDIKEGLILLRDNSESVFLSVILLAILFGIYVRSPYRARKLEEIKRLQETNTLMAKNNADTISRVEINTKTISQIMDRMDKLQWEIKQLGEGHEDVLREIREVQQDLKDIQTSLNANRRWR